MDGPLWGTGPRLNENYFLVDGRTVFDDEADDKVTGSAGMVWHPAQLQMP